MSPQASEAKSSSRLKSGLTDHLVNSGHQLCIVTHMAAACTFPRTSLTALSPVWFFLDDVCRYDKTLKAAAS